MADAKDKESKNNLRSPAEQAEKMRDAHPVALPEVPVVPRPVRSYRARVFQSYIVAATVGFAVLFFFARHVAYFRFDLSVERWLQGWHTFWLDVLMHSVSELGFSPLAPIFVVSTMVFV